MKNDCLYVRGATRAENEQSRGNDELDTVRTQSKELYHQCVLYNQKHYDIIVDKVRFEEDLLEMIAEEYWEFQEGYESKEDYFETLAEYFTNFLLAEQECHKIEEIITVQDILERNAELNNLKIDDIEEVVAHAIYVVAENYKDEKSIYYCRDVVYSEIICEVRQEVEERRQRQFEKTYSQTSKIGELLRDKIQVLNDKDALLQHVQFLVQIGELKTPQMILEKADEMIEECLWFERLCDRFESCNYVKTVDLTPEKEKLFMAVEKGEITVNEENQVEYYTYQEIMPYYYSALYNKKRTKLKPSIEKINNYFEFAKEAIGLLIKNRVVIKKGEEFEYNTCGDVDQYIKDIGELLVSAM